MQPIAANGALGDAQNLRNFQVLEAGEVAQLDHLYQPRVVLAHCRQRGVDRQQSVDIARLEGNWFNRVEMDHRRVALLRPAGADVVDQGVANNSCKQQKVLLAIHIAF